MEKRFLEFCEKQDLFTPHRRVLVALSGGLDSMNLYELLYKNKSSYRFIESIWYSLMSIMDKDQNRI